MHGGYVAHKLHARPNLEHLKKQAKTLLAKRGSGFKLADAQLEVARGAGFASWPRLVRHVDALRALEGEWTFAGLEIDGAALPAAASANSRILIDGDRFRMESVEGVYDGTFAIDIDAAPATIDIAFVEGPEAGNTALGIFVLDTDQLTICLGLVGSERPTSFTTSKGSGHALERLRRASKGRPANVTGGNARPAVDTPAESATVDPSTFDGPMGPSLKKMEGEWTPTLLVRDGEPMNDQWLAFGSRIGVGNEVKVVFGGQTQVHARVRVNEAASPLAIDYLGMHGPTSGKVSLGILEWAGDTLRINMAPPGSLRPDDFTCAKGSGRTLSEWKRR
jgi:uncharacterized protein (TIGR03067 family)